MILYIIKAMSKVYLIFIADNLQDFFCINSVCLCQKPGHVATEKHEIAHSF